MMDRRTFLAVAGLLTTPPAVNAQQAGRRHRIGCLFAMSQAASDAPVVLPTELSTRGYTQGRNLAIEWRWADGNVARLQELGSSTTGPTRTTCGAAPRCM
jgi:hypothetical protein